MVRSLRSGRLEPWPSSISCRPVVQDSVDLRQLEDLAGIDEVGVADLILVRLVDHRVLHAPSIGAPGDAPQRIAGLHDEEGLAGLGDAHRLARERRLDAGEDLTDRKSTRLNSSP